MEDVKATLEQAIEQHQAGHLGRAIPLYRHVLDSTPDHIDTLYLLGTALLQSGEFGECADCLQRVVAARPDIPDARNNLGVAYKAQGQWEQAVKTFEATIRAHPEYQQAYFNLGALMYDRGVFRDAEKCFRRGLEVNPRDIEPRFSLGNALAAQRRWPEAEQCCREVVARDPNNIDAHVALAFALVQQEKLTEATQLYQQVLSVRPEFHEVHNNLSYVFERTGRLEQALQCAQRTIELQPDFAEAYNNLGIALRSLHRIDDALAAFRSALKLQPDFPLAEYNLGTTLLLTGRYHEGWPAYERRSETLDEPPRTFEYPRWSGRPIPEKRLLVHCDQGFGDTLQFARLLPGASQRSQARLIFECPPELVRLFADFPGVDELVIAGETLPPCDEQIPLASLAGLLEIEIDTIPRETPYLRVSVQADAPVRSVLESIPANKPRVGLIWRGNRQQARDVVRSCPPAQLERLLAVEAVSFVSLQVGSDYAEEIAGLSRRQNVWDAGSYVDDFSGTAAVMQTLDLVITVDTSPAHVAGALGLPVWTLLCHTPDWRWHLDRDDSPWYPTMRLFRQRTWGDWKGVVNEAAHALTQFVETWAPET
ncbi:MAG: hypothetical protein CMJ48_11115 [Planctomycetaceae bacterium]|nr:hypothetical protein [Planctomycetaceae bacterium]